MGKITDIKPQSRNKGRVSIFIDGRFFCGLEKLTALSHRLAIGDEIDTRQLAKAVFDSESAAAFEKAAKYLGMRPRTENEIRVYLGGKGYTQEVTAAAVDKLTGYGYIDDKEYCRMYIESYKHKSGARKIEAELLGKGIERDTVAEALDGLDSQTDAVTRIAEKYLFSHKADKRKLTAYLMNKGFDYDTVKEALGDMEINGD